MLSAIAIVGLNALALYIIGNTPKMRTPQHLYRMSLAVSDILLGTSFFLPSIYFGTVKFFFPKSTAGNISPNSTDKQHGTGAGVFPGVVGFLSWMSVSVSFLTLVAASFDRVVATLFARRYVKNAQRKITMIVCVVIWALVAGATVVGTVRNEYGLEGPFFVLPVDEGFDIQTAVVSLVMLGLMLANSSIVVLKLYFHNRFSF